MLGSVCIRSSFELFQGAMGCAVSKIDRQEKVMISKERKVLMKQLVELRREFSNAQAAYLKALKNMGVTLRQFTESELLESESSSCCTEFPPSPPLPLPPSPPPPPPFSPDFRQSDTNKEADMSSDERSNIDVENDLVPAPPVISTSWNFWDTYEPTSPKPLSEHQDNSRMAQSLNDEKSLETTVEGQEETLKPSLNQPQQGRHPVELIDDNSLDTWNRRNDSSMSRLRKKKKTVHCVVKELDVYFLKAYDSGNDVAVLIDTSTGDILSQRFDEHKRKKSNSATVFNALSWSWSSRSLQPTQHPTDICSSTEPCNPGANAMTLDKLFAAEQNLYRLVKEDETVKVEHEKKLVMLKKEEGNLDSARSERIRSCIDELVTDNSRLQYSISTTSSSILEIIDAELYPQLVAITSGSKNMWTQMYECHQVQSDISQQLNHLNEEVLTDLTTDYHRQATAQLESEVQSWLTSFSDLVISQRSYSATLSKWIQLTDCLQEEHRQSSYSSALRRLCHEWQLACHNLPDKIVSEAIKNLLAGIHSVMQQQTETKCIGRKFSKLEKRLLKELGILEDMENKAGESHTGLSPRDPLTLKRAKIEGLKKIVDGEKSKYQDSINVTRAMTLNKLKAHLPTVFMALMEFSSCYAQALEAIYIHGEPVIEAAGSHIQT